MEKIFIITENYRNEKNGDSTEQVTVKGAYRENDDAQKKVAELFEEEKKNALRFFDEEDLITEIGPYGAQIYYNYEWDTYHCDYSIIETTLE